MGSGRDNRSRSCSPARSDRERAARSSRRERDEDDGKYRRGSKWQNDERGYESRGGRRERDEQNARSSRYRQSDRDHDQSNDRDRYRDGEQERERKRPRRRDGDDRENEQYGRDRERERERRYDDRDRDRDGDKPRYGSTQRERSRSADGVDSRGHDRERIHERDRERENGRRARVYDDDRFEEHPPRAGPSHEARPGSSRSKSSDEDAKKVEDKSKPNFKNSGLLAAATNTVKREDGTSTVIKYNEPPEARRPTVNYRLYVFKGQEDSGVLLIHDQTCYLVGRDKAVCDIYIEHPSCSKQHAAIQYRQVLVKDDLGSSKPVVKPYIIDLDSTNHTYVNDEEIPKSRFYEIQMGDVIKFGMSTREYVLMRDDAA